MPCMIIRTITAYLHWWHAQPCTTCHATGLQARARKLSELGFEPRFPRSQRGVLTAIRFRHHDLWMAAIPSLVICMNFWPAILVTSLSSTCLPLCTSPGAANKLGQPSAARMQGRSVRCTASKYRLGRPRPFSRLSGMI